MTQVVDQTVAQYKSAKATAGAVEAANRASDIAERTIHTSEQAYLVSELVDPKIQLCNEGAGQPGRRIIPSPYGCNGQFHYINVGKTPALSVVVTIKLYTQNPEHLNLPIPAYTGTTGGAVAENVDQTEPVQMSPQEYQAMFAMRDVGGEYSAVGYIQYTDIFGGTHVTKVCDSYPVQIRNSGGPPPPLRVPYRCPGGWVDHPPDNKPQ